MKPKLIVILSICLALSGCSTLRDSVLLGAGSGGALGSGVGVAAGNNFRSAMLGLGIGAVVGGTIGYLAHKDRERRERLEKIATKKDTDSKVPSLTSPEVRRVWVPEKIDGDKFIEGHFMYLIEHNSVWTR